MNISIIIYSQTLGSTNSYSAIKKSNFFYSRTKATLDFIHIFALALFFCSKIASKVRWEATKPAN